MMVGSWYYMRNKADWGSVTAMKQTREQQVRDKLCQQLNFDSKQLNELREYHQSLEAKLVTFNMLDRWSRDEEH